jgi:hypothetical protein
MQLKVRRSQREGGVISKNVIFCLDARVDFTAQEQQHITRYKLHNQVIYNSEASARHLAKADAQRDGSIGGSLKSLASVAMAAMKLNISIASLQRGQHIECKSLDELLGAEEAIMTACENLRGYLDTAATFDGREILVDFDTSGPKVIAQAVSPAPALVVPAATPLLPHAPIAAASQAIPASAGIEEVPPPQPGSAQFYASKEYSSPNFWSGLDDKQRLLVISAVVVLVIMLLVRCGAG